MHRESLRQLFSRRVLLPFSIITGATLLLLLPWTFTNAQLASGTLQARSSSSYAFRGGIGTIIEEEDRHPPVFDREAWLAKVAEANVYQDPLDEEQQSIVSNNSTDQSASSSSQSSKDKGPIYRPAPAHCHTQARTFLTLFGGGLFCSEYGYATPGLFGGDCPISACVAMFGGEDPEEALFRWGNP